MGSARATAGFAAALALFGLGFGMPSLLVAGLGLAALLVAAAAWVALSVPKRLLREPGPSRVTEGDEYPVEIRAVGGRLPPPGGELRDPLLAAPVAVGPSWDGAVSVRVRLEGRGRRALAPASLVIRDPLGLRARRLESATPGEVLVLPRIEPVSVSGRGIGGTLAGAGGGLEDGAAASALEARALELEIDGLRGYRPGSPASRIHWPAVARTGELIERRLVAGADAAPLVVLDAARPAGEAALDAAVRAAASLCVHLARAGGCAVLLPGERRPTTIDRQLRGWPAVHVRLALVEAGDRPPLPARAARSGAVFWVTASARPSLPAGLRGGAPGARYLVAPAPDAAMPGPSAPDAAAPGGGVAGATRAVFTVAGCVGTRPGAARRRPLRTAA